LPGQTLRCGSGDSGAGNLAIGEQNVWLRGDRLRGDSPNGRECAAVAVANQPAMNRADVEFKITVLQQNRGAAKTAFQVERWTRGFAGRGRREFELPEIDLLIDEGNAVSVDFFLRANLTENADSRFTIGFQRAQNHFLIGNKCMGRENSRAMQAEDGGLGILRKEAALDVGTNEHDGNLFGQSPTTAVVVIRHLGNLGKGPRIFTVSG